MSVKYDRIDDLQNEEYGVYEQGQKVGYIKVRFEVDLRMCTIMDIYVREDLQRQGRGTLLVRHIEELAIQKGCKKVYVHAIAPEVKDFFVKCGYQLSAPDAVGDYDAEKSL